MKFFKHDLNNIGTWYLPEEMSYLSSLVWVSHFDFAAKQKRVAVCG